jgi:2-dehydro-3-deoxy-D-arabinonate dehydratase
VSTISLVRFFIPDLGVRVGTRVDDLVLDVTGTFPTVSSWLRSSAGRVDGAMGALRSAAERATQSYPTGAFDVAPDPQVRHWLAPVDGQEVWASGVTYQRSREARQEEAGDGGDVYARVYGAERPELFFKANGHRVVGPNAEVGIREDSSWNVPEPELALLINPAMEVVGLTIGNDMSSRDIEGANPLYLPQAKVYTASCALGPGIVTGRVDEWPRTTIRLSIDRGGAIAFYGQVETSQIHRVVAELVEYLGRSNTFPDGVVLFTGTGIVPPADFTLAAGDVISITIDSLGTLTNTVKVV